MTSNNTPRARLEAIQKHLLGIKEKATAESRDFTDEEAADVETKANEAIELKGEIERAERGASLLAAIGGRVDEEPAHDYAPGGSLSREKGYLAVTGRKGRDLARTVAGHIDGAKALVASVTALALDLSTVGLDIDTQGLAVDADTATGFGNNTVRFRVETRAGLSVIQPAGIVHIELTEDTGE